MAEALYLLVERRIEVIHTGFESSLDHVNAHGIEGHVPSTFDVACAGARRQHPARISHPPLRRGREKAALTQVARTHAHTRGATSRTIFQPPVLMTAQANHRDLQARLAESVVSHRYPHWVKLNSRRQSVFPCSLRVVGAVRPDRCQRQYVRVVPLPRRSPSEGRRRRLSSRGRGLAGGRRVRAEGA